MHWLVADYSSIQYLYWMDQQYFTVFFFRHTFGVDKLLSIVPHRSISNGSTPYRATNIFKTQIVGANDFFISLKINNFFVHQCLVQHCHHVHSMFRFASSGSSLRQGHNDFHPAAAGPKRWIDLSALHGDQLRRHPILGSRITENCRCIWIRFSFPSTMNFYLVT